jgi:hypothetical protein
MTRSVVPDRPPHLQIAAGALQQKRGGTDMDPIMDMVALAAFRRPRADREMPRWRRPGVLVLLNGVLAQARRRQA